MDAWVTRGDTLVRERVPDPTPAPDELLVRVEACGVCRTDLHVVDGDLPVHRRGVIPGHQAVGTVVGAGDAVRSTGFGDRVGVAWLHRTCGACRWCRAGRENLCPDATFTGWDHDGGFAELVTVPEAFAYPIPQADAATDVAPLLCAGIIGYRALRRANLPPGGVLGLYGFGSSASLTAQLAKAQGARVVVITRGERDRALARELEVDFVGDQEASPPEPLDSAIVFAPVGAILAQALEATARGGTVVSAGIHMSPVPSLDYDRTLFYERDLRSVTANTRADGSEFLALARHLRLAPAVTDYGFARVNDALADLRDGRAGGSLVVRMA